MTMGVTDFVTADMTDTRLSVFLTNAVSGVSALTTFSFESSALVRQRILQQAATAVLAQSNLQPQIALALLK